MSGRKYGLILKKNEPMRRIQRSQIFDEDGLEDDDDSDEVEQSQQSQTGKSATIKGPTLPPKPTLGSIKSSVFNQDDEDDEDEEEEAFRTMDRKKNAFGSSKVNREAKACIQKALEEDPNVFAYDDLYEDIQSKRLEEKEAGQKVRGASKYVDSLLRSAQLRKIEEQRRVDRKIEKERAAEGEEFDDKETFVTEAYKQKLLERQIFEEKERQEQQLEGKHPARSPFANVTRIGIASN
jgi:hypothetical protein